MKKALFLCNADRESGSMIDFVYGAGRREKLAELTDLYPAILKQDQLAAHQKEIAHTEALFSTWGMPELSAGELDLFPKLQAVFYAAGSVKRFAPPLLDRNILVVSAWAANAIPVAELCLAQILLSCKGYFRNTQASSKADTRINKRPFVGRGAYGETVALIGAGQIARYLISLLKLHRLRIVVVDPYLPDEEAIQLGVERVSLEKAFAEAYVVSNHLPNLPELGGVLNRPLFASMRADATFINTGRGRQVNEADLSTVFAERTDLTALLDVTDPEPPAPDSPLYTLPNVHLTSHIAGASNDEVLRMADTVIEEYQRWVDGQPLRYAVSQDMLARMA